MRPEDIELARHLSSRLDAFAARHALPGIAVPGARESLVAQLVDSVRRVRYVQLIRGRNTLSDVAADSNNVAFDPLKAALIHKRQGNVDEAFWLVFLSTHFGKHKIDKWKLAQSVYGGLGKKQWNWKEVTSNLSGLQKWFAKNERILTGADGVKGRFGNHRKYESLKTNSPTGTLAVIGSYIDWIAPLGSHQKLIADAQSKCDGGQRETFDMLYQSMGRTVLRFGRTARFDYLSMIGKLGLAPIEPGSAYLKEATGPLSGAKLLFSGSKTAKTSSERLDALVVELDAALESPVGFGLQVLEDALCNWQKSPNAFKSFRG